MKTKFVLPFLICLFALITVQANDKSKTEKKSSNTIITGTVVDVCNGEPLVGVLITIEGTNTKLYTDFDGQFQIPVTNTEIILKTSLISYKTNRLVLNSETESSTLELALESL